MTLRRLDAVRGRPKLNLPKLGPRPKLNLPKLGPRPKLNLPVRGKFTNFARKPIKQ